MCEEKSIKLLFDVQVDILCLRIFNCWVDSYREPDPLDHEYMTIYEEAVLMG